jgi:SAM-dependent methyltransferase
MFSLSWIMRPIDVRRDVRKQISAMLSHLRPKALVYDIGCGNKPFAKSVKDLGCEYIGVDVVDGFYDSEKIDLVGSAYSVPVADAIADAVLSVQVIEHLERPKDALREAYRILKPGGVLLISFPFLYPIHAAPHDYMRYTHFFLLSVAKEIGFEVVEQHELKGFWYMVGMYAGLYLQAFDKGILRWFGLTRLLIAIIQWTCRGLHGVEYFLLKAMKRSVNGFRQAWTVNYAFTFKKRDY